ncbi:ABC transporter ATP-binding protein [Actinocatenispora rupis]|uniref:Iron-enterobactin transporter ATP-binding protein n=1 Tax=Actinocatenispora rupis TaxID=519421 RepID=A0A8J3NG61_9ACTN|nr:ABC transporter ATP-binding protein [Actinocatenispora rupis]GID15620.1 iron-enterobactin transporter ATP-binding protein [Actinocatenispora rupis]
MTGPSLVAARGIGVRVGAARLLGDVDLDVPEGGWLTVIGPNGAGKSTLLRALAGLVPHEGTVTVAGEQVDRLHRRQRARLIALVPQNPVVPPGMSVLDYTLLGRTPYIAPLAVEGAADLAAAHAVLDRLDLTGFADRTLDTLSGGERQRVYLARALAQGARLLLLDEPTSALDIGHQQDVLELVDELRTAEHAPLTVLATMHELSVAGEYADRILLLAAGSVVATGTPDEVLTEELLAHHYRARVRVVPGERGPLVVPVRRR